MNNKELEKIAKKIMDLIKDLDIFDSVKVLGMADKLRMDELNKRKEDENNI